MFTNSFHFASIYVLFTVVCIQIGSIACQMNSTVGIWELQALLDRELFIDGPLAASADLSVLAIGNPSYINVSDNSFSTVGRVRVIRYNEFAMPQWERLGADMDGEKKNDYFGDALAMSTDGLTVAVGANGNDGERPGFESIGHVRVLKFNNVTKTWKQVGADIDGEEAYDFSGTAVTISADGTIVAIASPLNGRFGRVRVYQLNLTTQQWEQMGADIDNDVYKHSILGTIISMSADGKTIAIGSEDDLDFGYVQAYTYSTSSKQWNVLGAVLTGTKKSKYFGLRTSMSADGTTIAATSEITLFDKDDGIVTYEYHVHVFKFSEANASWSQVGEIIETSNTDSIFIFDMSNDGKTIAVGILGDRRVRVYKNTYGTSWNRVGSDINGSIKFLSVSADGTSVAVKAKDLRVYTLVPTSKCEISWNLYNAKTNAFVAPLVNGTIISNPPPCNETNIEAVVPCAPINGTVLMELYLVSTTTGKLSLVHRRRERFIKFFLFGNSRNDIFGGRVPSGTYMIRSFNNVGAASPEIKFTLGGSCV